MPLTFDPPVKAPEDLAVAQQAKGSDGKAVDGRIRCWLQGEPVRTLPNLAKVPAVVVTAEASFHATLKHIPFPLRGVVKKVLLG